MTKPTKAELRDMEIMAAVDGEEGFGGEAVTTAELQSEMAQVFVRTGTLLRRMGTAILNEKIEEVFSTILDAAITIDDLVFTRDTIDDFKASRNLVWWWGQRINTAVTKLPVEIEFVQVRVQPPVENGPIRSDSPYTDLFIMDFGDVRVCFNDRDHRVSLNPESLMSNPE
jgi:hypothetical protein